MWLGGGGEGGVYLFTTPAVILCTPDQESSVKSWGRWMGWGYMEEWGLNGAEAAEIGRRHRQYLGVG